VKLEERKLYGNMYSKINPTALNGFARYGGAANKSWTPRLNSFTHRVPPLALGFDRRVLNDMPSDRDNK
jgi:hypothetical protein